METDLTLGESALHDNDKRLFTDLYEQHQAALLRLLYRLTGHWSVAEDALQHAFVRLIEGRERFDLSKSPRNLLVTIALNHVRRGYRDRRRPTIEARDPQNRADRVQDVILRLPADERAVIVLYYYEHFSYAEIAEMLSMPLGTVKWKMHEVIRQLRSQLEAWTDEM